MLKNQSELSLYISPEDVKRIREKTGMTQKEFSETFGVNLSTLRHWERGDRSPSGASLILLNLIDKAPREIYSILEARPEGKMNSLEDKKALKDTVTSGEFQELCDLAKTKPEKIKHIILALISANGFPYKNSIESNGIIEFYAGHDQSSLNLILTLDLHNSVLSGSLSKTIEKTYLVIDAIENELSSAMYLPHEMRQARINSVITRIGVDTSFYSTILRNW